MNWVIRDSEKIKFHTDLEGILKPIWNDLLNYSWIITDIDFISSSPNPLNFEQDIFFMDSLEFETLLNSNTQIIWGIISAVNNDTKIEEEKLLKISSESNEVWEENTFLIPESILEIVAFDSGYTILKFKEEKLSEKFKDYFGEEAIELSKYK
jgi:hypothetical protein